jgi:hypothetical protein
VSVIDSGPDEGHDDRETWIETYAEFIPEPGMRLEGGPEPRGFAEGEPASPSTSPDSCSLTGASSRRG